MGLLRRRLYTQRLAGQPMESPEDVVRLLGAVQSQDYPGAKWSLGQRCRDATDATVDAAVSAGRIIRTHVLRPTWHFVAPEDLRPLLRLSGARVLAQSAYQNERLELDAGLFRRVHALLERELRDGRHSTRLEVGAALGRAGIRASGQRLAHIMAEAELTGLVCSGRIRGKQQTYALLNERAPPDRRETREETLARLTLRFFTGHGPATLRHFAWWAGLTLGEAKAGLALVERGLAREEHGERAYWSDPSLERPRRDPAAAWLLPEFDEIVLGYKDWLHVLPTGAWPKPVVAGSRQVGTWRRTQERGRVVVEVRPFVPLSAPARRALERSVERYAAFLRVPVQVA